MAPFLLRIPQVERTGGLEERSLTMCDYSLHNVKSRAARVGDKLTTCNFGTGTRGFAAQEDTTMAVCVLPGTELAFSREVACTASGFLGLGARGMGYQTGSVRQGKQDATRGRPSGLEITG